VFDVGVVPFPCIVKQRGGGELSKCVLSGDLGSRCRGAGR